MDASRSKVWPQQANQPASQPVGNHIKTKYEVSHSDSLLPKIYKPLNFSDSRTKSVSQE